MLRVMNPNPESLKVRDPERFKHMDSPFHGAPHGEDHGGDHGGEHGAEGKTHSFFDNRKKREDRGYAMSLRVIGGGMKA
jgi:hypothetical protein